MRQLWGRLAGGAVFILRRLATAIVGLLGITVIVFVLSHDVGNPVYIILGQKGTPAQVARLSHQYGFDRPIFVQYWSYVTGLLRGSLGTDLITQQSVSSELAIHFPPTLELCLAAIIIGVIWAVPLGVLAAVRPNGVIDRISQYLVRLGAAMPSFWLGLLLAFLFFYVLNWLPAPTGQLGLGVVPPPRVTGMIVVDSVIAGDGQALRVLTTTFAIARVDFVFTACGPILALTRSAMRDASAE